MAELPDWCCASGCKKCTAWKEQQQTKCQTCQTCHSRPAKPERKTCQNCIDLAVVRKKQWETRHPKQKRKRPPSARHEYRRARYRRALASGLCSSCLARPAFRGLTRCQQCSERHSQNNKAKRRKIAEAEKLYSLKDYVPADEWTARRKNQVMRVLRRRDWTTAEEVCDELGVPNGSYCTAGDNLARNTIGQTIRRLASEGLLQRRRLGRCFPFEYRVTSGLPASVFEPPIDTAVIDDGYQEAACSE